MLMLFATIVYVEINLLVSRKAKDNKNNNKKPSAYAEIQSYLYFVNKQNISMEEQMLTHIIHPSVILPLFGWLSTSF